MKISRVKWRSHPILGDLELDFINATTGMPYGTILLAGENGTGKTSVLASMSKFLNIGSFQYFDFFEYIINGQNYRAIPQTRVPNHHTFFDLVMPNSSIKHIVTDRSNNTEAIWTDNSDIRSYGCVFSKARADYKTNKIQSTTTKILDSDRYDVDNEDDFTSLKQLIVDVETQDYSDYTEINRNRGNAPMPWDDFYHTSKIFRFKNAFDSFFEKLKYDKVDNLNSQKSILFKKNGQSISIDDLSTGEKQIVFRGIFLLRNSGNLNGASIMIDEPELSMHPKWQKGIFKYYKDLFIEAGIQKVQLFLASHSEHVLENALENKIDNLVIVLSEESGIITAKRIDAPGVLPSITAAETNYLAFDIVSKDYHIELYGWLQDKEALATVKSCDDFIKNHRLYNRMLHHKSSAFGRTTYDTLSTFIRNVIHHPDQARTFTDAELRTSIELLIALCR